MEIKQADSTPLTAQLVAAVLGLGLMGADQEHTEHQRAEAAMFNELARVAEAQKMEQTIHALSPKMAAAQQIIESMLDAAAASAATEMDKEAFGALLGGLARAGGAALRGLGGAASAAGRLMPVGATGRMLAAGGEAAKAPALSRAGGWLASKGQSLAAAGAKAAPAAAAAAPAAGGSLLSAGTKAKMVGGAALLGAGYLGMKGLQAGRDYMMQPTGSNHGPEPMHNVNQYGYPQY